MTRRKDDPTVGGPIMPDAIGAIVEEAGGAVVIEPLQIDQPEAGEVLVRIVASGVCHSDLWARDNGNWGSPFPLLLGHEGAGIVEEVGTGVETVAPGDAVVLSWAVPCGACRPCQRGIPRRCSHAWTQPPRIRRQRDGALLFGVLGCGTLATHTVVHAEQAIPLPSGIPLESACLLGCGVSTGVGAAILGRRPLRGLRRQGGLFLRRALLAEELQLLRAQALAGTPEQLARQPVDARLLLTDLGEQLADKLMALLKVCGELGRRSA